ncbi:lysophospholipid acyltransferase family protein [Candidatus Pelagibacter sp.]|uniref:lysophospholipid acyltransferase family protein n=1 Tax=Candidatus Pelagibacter sp. TaxID=2024849 RepID=UPI003F86EA60
MKLIVYFFQFILTSTSFIIFKILGPKLSSYIGGKIFEKIGPFFRSKNIIHSNIKKAIPNINSDELNKLTSLMWNNYGRTFAEYMFIKDFRKGNLKNNIQIEGKEILEDIQIKKKQVIFISGHFANFELMAMYLEKSGIDLSAIYRPLNNIFINLIMERIRKKFICKNQIKKGIGGMKNLIKYKKKNFSTALMIDQRVSEGILSNFFNQKALTTTVPAQLAKKFNIPIVPVSIKRLEGINFKINVESPILFKESQSIQSITDELNLILEKMITKNPSQWIWSHNRWK